MMKWILIGLFIFSLGIGAAVRFWPSSKGGGSADEVDWRNLAELDYTTSVASEALKKRDNTRVKIPGFMVPLEDNSKKVTEFLLVPSPQACIHVPAPPPNQMVYVKMKEGTSAAFGPIWVYGEFKISTKRSQYGEASFEMEADTIEPYN